MTTEDPTTNLLAMIIGGTATDSRSVHRDTDMRMSFVKEQ